MADKITVTKDWRTETEPLVVDGFAIHQFGAGFVVARGDGVARYGNPEVDAVSMSHLGVKKGRTVMLVASLAEAMDVVNAEPIRQVQVVMKANRTRAGIVLTESEMVEQPNPLYLPEDEGEGEDG